MSAPSDAWILDDFQDNMDPRETDQGIELRHHRTIVRHQRIIAANVPSATLQEQNLISFYVGDIMIFKGTTGLGAAKYVCVGDGFNPTENPTDYVDREQTWELYTPWEPAPGNWNG